MANEDSGLFSCRNTCWIAGALLGVTALLLINSPWGVAIVVGIVVAIAVGFALQKMFCSGTDVAATVPAAVAPSEAETGAPVQAESRPVVTPPMEEPVADVVEVQAPEVATEPEVPAAKTEDAPSAEPEVAPAPAAPVAAPGAGPELLDAPRGGAADDLKKIKGVGPGLEKKMNEAGIWHYDQIASWDAADIAAMDDKLSFRGRITRDDWVGQAKVLAAGGTV